MSLQQPATWRCGLHPGRWRRRPIGWRNGMDNMLQFMKLVGQLKVSEIRINTNVLRVNLLY